MTRFWTCHWQNRFWRPDVNRENAPCCSSGSNSFQKRGVSAGDVAYIVSIADGQLLLGGRMTVKRIVREMRPLRIGTTRTCTTPTSGSSTRRNRALQLTFIVVWRPT